MDTHRRQHRPLPPPAVSSELGWLYLWIQNLHVGICVEVGWGRRGGLTVSRWPMMGVRSRGRSWACNGLIRCASGTDGLRGNGGWTCAKLTVSGGPVVDSAMAWRVGISHVRGVEGGVGVRAWSVVWMRKSLTECGTVVPVAVGNGIGGFSSELPWRLLRPVAVEVALASYGDSCLSGGVVAPVRRWLRKAVDSSV